MNASDAVQEYVDHSRRIGYEPLHSDKARVGRAAKELLANNKSDDIIIGAVQRAAERNQPGSVTRLAGDIERGAVGPGPINPIDSRILGFHIPVPREPVTVACIASSNELVLDFEAH